MKYKNICAAALMVLFSTPAAHAQQVISIAQDSDFSEANMRWNGANANGYDARVALKNVKGKLALCGVGLITNAQLASAVKRGIRGGTVKINGKTVLKDFSFFAKAPSMRDLPKTKANCMITNAPIPKESDRLRFRYGSATFRN